MARTRTKMQKVCSQCGRKFSAKPCGFSHAELGGWRPVGSTAKRKTADASFVEGCLRLAAVKYGSPNLPQRDVAVAARRLRHAAINLARAKGYTKGKETR